MATFFKNKSIYSLYCLLIILLAFDFFTPAYAIPPQSYKEEKIKIEFTDTEKAYIKNNPEVSIALIDEWYPMSFRDNGTLKGLSVDMLRIIEEKTGFVINLIPDSWPNCLTKFKAGKVDIIDGITYLPKRSSFTLFTDPYYELPTIIMGRHDFGVYSGLESLKGKKAAVIRDIFFMDELKKISGINIIEYDTTKAQIRALAFEKVDVAINNYSNCQRIISQSGYTGLKVLGELNINGVGREDLRFGIRKGLPVLHGIISKGLKAISREEFLALRNQWIGAEITERLNIPKPAARDKIVFTPEEQKYLKQKGTIKVCIDPQWAPFEFLDKKGEHQGITRDLFDLFREISDINFELISTDSWNQTISYAKNRQCDLVSQAAPTPSRLDYLNFTSTFLDYPQVIATDKTKPFINEVEDILDKKIGAVEGYAIIETLKSKYPDIKIITYKNLNEGLLAVANNQIYGFVDFFPALAYEIQQGLFTNLKISGKIEEKIELSIATRKDEPLLNDIMEKLLQTISPEDYRNFFDKWVAVKYGKGLDYKLFWKIIAGITFLSLIFFFRYFIVSKYNRKLTEMNLALEALSKTDRLTNLANRHHLDDILNKEISRASRYNTFFSVIIGDVDHFKSINDTFGHNTGDRVLKAIASIMNLYTRQSELIGRWGGEEFLIICPESDLNGAMQLAEKLRRAIENHDFKIDQTITMSFGVSSHLKNENGETIISKADKALYQAKRSGRNKVVDYNDS